MAGAITMQGLIDASLDSESLEIAVNGDENTNVDTRLGSTYPTLAKAMKIVLEQGTLNASVYKTQSLMTSSSSIEGDYALVTDDADISKNGYYQKRSGIWSYLPYNFARIFNELASNYVAPQGVIAAGTDLNTIKRAGVYLGTFGSNYINSPVADTFLLIVHSAGGFGTNNGRWVSKTIISLLGNKTYHRVDDMNNIDNTRKWYSIPDIGELSALTTVSKSSIVSAINETLVTARPYKGSLVNPALKDLVGAGDYVLTGLAGNTELPVGYVGSVGLFSVEVFGTFINQKIVPTTTRPWEYYIRSLRNGVVQAWKSVGFIELPPSPYTGRTAIFLGDSITENGDYPARVGARLGLTTINGGFGGTRLTEMTTDLAGMCGVDVADAIASGDWSIVRAGANARYAARPSDDNRPIVDRLEAVDWLKVNYIVCFWGTNDWSNDVQIGADADNNRATIKGAANYIIGKVLNKYPHIQMMWIAPMFRARITPGDAKDSDNYPNVNGVYLSEIGDAIGHVAKKYHLPFYHLYHSAGLNLLNYKPYLLDQTIDGLHPNGEMAHQWLADKIAAAFTANF